MNRKLIWIGGASTGQSYYCSTCKASGETNFLFARCLLCGEEISIHIGDFPWFGPALIGFFVGVLCAVALVSAKVTCISIKEEMKVLCPKIIV